jgi:hypothetical protein
VDTTTRAPTEPPFLRSFLLLHFICCRMHYPVATGPITAPSLISSLKILRYFRAIAYKCLNFRGRRPSNKSDLCVRFRLTSLPHIIGRRQTFPTALDWIEKERGISDRHQHYALCCRRSSIRRSLCYILP